MTKPDRGKFDRMREDNILREVIADTLEANGIGPVPPTALHSWRCEYEHGCYCFRDLVTDLMMAVYQE